MNLKLRYCFITSFFFFISSNATLISMERFSDEKDVIVDVLGYAKTGSKSTITNQAQWVISNLDTYAQEYATRVLVEERPEQEAYFARTDCKSVALRQDYYFKNAFLGQYYYKRPYNVVLDYIDVRYKELLLLETLIKTCLEILPKAKKFKELFPLKSPSAWKRTLCAVLTHVDIESMLQELNRVEALLQTLINETESPKIKSIIEQHMQLALYFKTRLDTLFEHFDNKNALESVVNSIVDHTVKQNIYCFDMDSSLYAMFCKMMYVSFLQKIDYHLADGAKHIVLVIDHNKRSFIIKALTSLGFVSQQQFGNADDRINVKRELEDVIKLKEVKQFFAVA